MNDFTDKELCYLFDALYLLTDTPRNSCSNTGNELTCRVLQEKIQSELEKRGLA
jgi:hypothetical protein